jgi:hypothetical protein
MRVKQEKNTGKELGNILTLPEIENNSILEIIR